MALGALLLTDHSKDYVSLSVTGIAGPGGATENKPVGTVCFAWAFGDSVLGAETKYLKGNRGEVRQQAMKYALTRLHPYLMSI